MRIPRGCARPSFPDHIFVCKNQPLKGGSPLERRKKQRIASESMVFLIRKTRVLQRSANQPAARFEGYTLQGEMGRLLCEFKLGLSILRKEEEIPRWLKLGLFRFLI